MNPSGIQSRILRRILQRNANSLYGIKFEFSKLKSVEDFQKEVPIVGYEDLDPCIHRILKGERQVLTEEVVLAFEKTSGSSGPSKLVPYTASLLGEFREAVRAWMYDLYLNCPSAAYGKTYWTLTPLARRRSSRAGIRVGFDTDMEYFDRFERLLLGQIQAVPSQVGRCSNLEASLYLTLRYLIQTPELSWFSVWNPTFLDILMERFEMHADRLIYGLKHGTLNSPHALDTFDERPYLSKLIALPQRALELEKILRSRGRIAELELFPNLGLISCWADASAKQFIPRIKERFPAVSIQGKGLLATEGVVSIPWRASGSVLSVHSQFYEFMEEGRNIPLLADQLDAGRIYEVIITTGGGFYRYRLGDLVRVLGHVEQTPILEFIGRKNGVTDLCGEKLESHFVDGVLAKLKDSGCFDADFAMLAPLTYPDRTYGLFIEGKIFSGNLAENLDTLLRANPHYDYCRALGQLRSPRIFKISKSSQESYFLRSSSAGQRLGGIKFNSLDSRQGWEHVFEGCFK